MKNSAQHYIDTLLFIKKYREMEIASLAKNKKALSSILPSDKFKHLFNSWSGRENNFGSFFLNLEYELQGLFLVHWGIPINGYNEYLTEIDSHPYASIYSHPPMFISWIDALMLFFNNHGIDEQVIPDFRMPFLPDKRYGNSANWGSYIMSLTLDNQLDVLLAIEENSFETLEQKRQNREYLRTATLKQMQS
ncbi:hypothetical protein [Pedobacter jeongneungensis]|uniref:hypothetical protein n=1 Tax=Pedobacter jeongneungensis TaxID=947309 RepID=UPI00046936F8|nr:hypothetical protein [Pedobacter jeongneungensis]